MHNIFSMGKFNILLNIKNVTERSQIVDLNKNLMSNPL